jgi:hypothetical protein
MIRSIFYQTGKPLQTDLKPDALLKTFRARRGVLWVVVSEPLGVFLDAPSDVGIAGKNFVQRDA